jgi:excisionase family DNA binding protein
MEADVLGDGLMTIEEACRFAKISRSSLYALLQQGRLASLKLGKSRRIAKTGLVAYLRARLVHPNPSYLDGANVRERGEPGTRRSETRCSSSEFSEMERRNAR